MDEMVAPTVSHCAVSPHLSYDHHKTPVRYLSQFYTFQEIQTDSYIHSTSYIIVTYFRLVASVFPNQPGCMDQRLNSLRKINSSHLTCAFYSRSQLCLNSNRELKISHTRNTYWRNQERTLSASCCYSFIFIVQISFVVL